MADRAVDPLPKEVVGHGFDVCFNNTAEMKGGSLLRSFGREVNGSNGKHKQRLQTNPCRKGGLARRHGERAAARQMSLWPAVEPLW